MTGRRIERLPRGHIRAKVTIDRQVEAVAQQLLAIAKNLPLEQQIEVMRQAAAKHGIDFDKLMAEQKPRTPARRRGRA